MRFPTTGILDTFDRPNEGPPPSANWTTGVYVGPVDGLVVLANECAVDPATVSLANGYWNVRTFGPDCEAYITIVTEPRDTAYVRLFARVQNVGAANMSGYAVAYRRDDLGFDRLLIERWDNSMPTNLVVDNTHYEIANGDKLGIGVRGDKIFLWHYTAGTWTVLLGTTDATYNAPGYIGVEIDDDPPANTGRLDDFGGGTYVPKRVLGGLTMGAGAGKGYATPDGTVYLKKTGTFDPFAWGGRCMRVDGDISETLRAMTVTTRQNPLGGIERDGILLGPPAETTLTLTMKRKQAERKKTELKKCLWTIDERIHCKDPQAWNAWEEITRACMCKANVRTLSGTSWGESEEMLVGLPQTCFQVVDIYRITGEEAVT